jgi:hypothetical protein
MKTDVATTPLARPRAAYGVGDASFACGVL